MLHIQGRFRTKYSSSGRSEDFKRSFPLVIGFRGKKRIGNIFRTASTAWFAKLLQQLEGFRLIGNSFQRLFEFRAERYSRKPMVSAVVIDSGTDGRSVSTFQILPVLLYILPRNPPSTLRKGQNAPRLFQTMFSG